MFAFSAGLIAAFNPCGAAMFPAYVGYQLEAYDGPTSFWKLIVRSLTLGLSVTAGFVLVFGAVGLILATGTRVIGDLLPFLGLGVGLTIAVMGMWLLVSRRHIGIMSAGGIRLGDGRGPSQTFLFGIAYAVASLSCALPIFLAAAGIVAGQALSGDDAVEALLGSVSYGLGMGSVMVTATLGIVFFKDVVSKLMTKVFPVFELLGNLAMVTAGLYLVYYWTIGVGQQILMTRLGELFD